MSRMQFFLMGVLLGMAAVGFTWSMHTIDRNLQRQIACEERLQVNDAVVHAER